MTVPQHQQLLPLEELFQKRTIGRPVELPNLSKNYFTQYQQMVNVLRTDYYPNIGTGLAANSSEPGFYTAHDGQHFDEVVLHAGILVKADVLLVAETTNPGPTELNAYELYLLLAAIRIHDVGNMYGRDGHEKKCFQILQQLGAAAGLDTTEKKIIARIAQAHGGKTSSGSKDTIEQLDISTRSGNVVYRPRLLAGIVRIADEICENRRRAANVLLQERKLPPHSEIYHLYAASIVSNSWSVSDRALHLKFEAKLCDIEKPWGCEARRIDETTVVKEVYLMDEIFSRLEKMDRERRYCNMYTREMFTIDAIKVTMDIVSDVDHDWIESVKIPELSDRGYPEDQGTGLRDQLQTYCGPAYGAALRQRMEA
jgi:hypothetical protein